MFEKRAKQITYALRSRRGLFPPQRLGRMTTAGSAESPLLSCSYPGCSW